MWGLTNAEIVQTKREQEMETDVTSTIGKE